MGKYIATSGAKLLFWKSWMPNVLILKYNKTIIKPYTIMLSHLLNWKGQPEFGILNFKGFWIAEWKAIRNQEK